MQILLAYCGVYFKNIYLRTKYSQSFSIGLHVVINPTSVQELETSYYKTVNQKRCEVFHKITAGHKAHLWQIHQLWRGNDLIMAVAFEAVGNVAAGACSG